MSAIRILVNFAADDLTTADQHVAQMRETCDRVSRMPGCLQFEVFRSAVEPTHYALIEHWASQAALEAFRSARGARPTAPAGVRLVREHYAYQPWEE
jgi:quinol monooxygenase YgiN